MAASELVDSKLRFRPSTALGSILVRGTAEEQEHGWNCTTAGYTSRLQQAALRYRAVSPLLDVKNKLQTTANTSMQHTKHCSEAQDVKDGKRATGVHHGRSQEQKHSTAQHSTAQHSTAQHSIAQEHAENV